MIGLLLAGRTGNHVKFTALVQLSGQGRAGAEVQVGVGKGPAGGGIHVHGGVNGVADFDGRSLLNLEHGVNGVGTLLGNIHLAADVLLIHGGSRVADRRGDGCDLALRNISGNDQLQFTGIVGASCGQVAFQNADRYPGPGGGGGQGEVIGLLLAGRTGNHVKFTALVQLSGQGRAGAEVQVGVGKGPAGGGIHVHGGVNGVADFDGRSLLNLEHGVNGVGTLLGNIHLAADVLLVYRGSGVADGGRNRRRGLGRLRLIGGSSRGGRGRLGVFGRGFRGNGTRLGVFGRSNRGGGVRLRAVAGSCGVGLRLGGWIRGVRCRLGLADGHVGAVILRCKGGGNVAHQQTEHQQQRQNSGTDFVHKKCPPIKFSMGISQ